MAKTADRIEKPEIEAAPGVRLVRVVHPERHHPFEVEIAEVEPLGLVARWPRNVRDADGSPLFNFWKVGGDGKTLESPLCGPNATRKGDEAAQFKMTWKTAYSPRPLRGSLEAIDPTAGEFGNFRKAWPEVAAALAAAGIPLAPPRREVPPELGDDVWLLSVPLRCTATALHDALRRFAAGDFGDHGRAGGHTPTPIERWSRAIQTRPVRNEIALADRKGVVLGRYPTPGRMQGAPGCLYVAAQWGGGATTTPASAWAMWQPDGPSPLED